MGLLARNDGYEPISFAEVICDKICSGHNQHVIMMIEGKTGTGKSSAAIDIAYKTSLLMADRMGGKPEDYFTIDNIAILTGEEVIRIAKNINQHGIYILDDVGAEGLSARKWQSDINMLMTKILQTFRTKENLLIMTVPDRGFVDKIARNLLHFKVVMKHAWFDKGITLAKLATVTKMYNKDNGGNIYPFIRHRGVIYNYAYFQQPPKFLLDTYDKRRKEFEEDMRISSIEEFEEAAKAAEENTPDKKRSKMDEQNTAIRILKETDPGLSTREIAKRVGCGKSKVAEVLKEFNLTSEFLSVH